MRLEAACPAQRPVLRAAPPAALHPFRACSAAARRPSGSKGRAAPLRLSGARHGPAGGRLADHPLRRALLHHPLFSAGAPHRAADARDAAAASRFRMHWLLGCRQEVSDGRVGAGGRRAAAAALHPPHRRAPPPVQRGSRRLAPARARLGALLARPGAQDLAGDVGHRCASATTLGAGAIGVCCAIAPQRQPRAHRRLRYSWGARRVWGRQPSLAATEAPCQGGGAAAAG
mmetsp:Transcript_17335/g.56717  ORF Transcript_17335/g.56717 Transcript_17335/m.56717 type:complete len:230 (-) Transcript_17335:2-691(-)